MTIQAKAPRLKKTPAPAITSSQTPSHSDIGDLFYGHPSGIHSTPLEPSGAHQTPEHPQLDTAGPKRRQDPTQRVRTIRPVVVRTPLLEICLPCCCHAG